MRNARESTLAGIGTVVAFAGFEHGLGELLQGPVAPPGLAIQSWPHSQFFRSLSGEPAMTVIPNLAASGIATMALSVALLVWTVRFVGRRYSAAVIAALSIALLLVGGGFAPPVLGLVLAIAATKVRSPLPWWRTRSPGTARRVLSVAWPLLFGASVASLIVTILGVASLAYFLGVESETLTLGLLLAMLVLLALALVSSMARDAEAQRSADPTDMPGHGSQADSTPPVR